MKSRYLFALFACLLVTALFTVGCGGGGSDDSISSPTGSNNPGTYEGTTSGSGVATGYVSSTAISQSVRMSVKSSVTSPAANATIEAGDYNEQGNFVAFGQTATTNDKGFYQLIKLPTGRKNIVIRVTLPTGVLEGILPEIKEGETASAPVIDPQTIYQSKLVKFAEKFDATFEINLGEILSVIPASKLPTTDTALEQIAQAFVNREKAQLQTFRAAGLADAKFVEFREFAFALQSKTNAGIADGLYSAEEGWKLFNDQLRLLARTLGLAPDVQLALQDVDSSMVNNSLPQGIVDTGVQQQLQYQNITAKLEGLLAALKVLTPTYLPQTDYDMIAAGVERIATALKTAPNAAAVETILKSDSLQGLIQAAFKTIYAQLNLLSGQPPLITKLYPNPADIQLIKTTTGYIPELASLTVSAAVRAQTVTPPTPTQISAYHNAIKDLIISKIKVFLPTLTTDQATALFVLLMKGPEMGFSYVPAEIPATGITSELPSQIMGVIVTSNSSLYIMPPAGYPEGPQAFGGFLAKLDPSSTINSTAVTATTTPHVYSGTYTVKATLNTPPTFKITGIINTTITVPELAKMSFTGGPLERDANGDFWFGLGQIISTKFVPDSETVKNAMQNLLGKAVQMEGIIVEKRPAPDFGPKLVKVFGIIPASSTGFIPPDVVIPTIPTIGTDITAQSGLWSFDKSPTNPANMFKFSWAVDGVTKSAYADFDPNSLVKLPQFRFQNASSGRDMWESDGHTVTVTGKLASDGSRLFITKFVDESTVWPNPEVPFAPPAPPTQGKVLTNLVGTWTVSVNTADSTKTFKLSWAVNGVATSAYVAFDPATLDKTPKFRFQDATNGHDMWESNDHQVTVTGTLSPDGTNLFITRFVDQSTVWPPISTLPTSSAMKIRGVLIPLEGFNIGHIEVSTGTKWVAFPPQAGVSPDIAIDAPPTILQQLQTIFGTGTNSPYGIELTGTWGVPTTIPGIPPVQKLHFIPTTARSITARFDTLLGWVFGS